MYVIRNLSKIPGELQFSFKNMMEQWNVTVPKLNTELLKYYMDQSCQNLTQWEEDSNVMTEIISQAMKNNNKAFKKQLRIVRMKTTSAANLAGNSYRLAYEHIVTLHELSDLESAMTPVTNFLKPILSSTGSFVIGTRV